MVGTSQGNRVVRTWTDSSCGTGESFKLTEDGTVWKTHYGQREAITGVTYGTDTGNEIRPDSDA